MKHSPNQGPIPISTHPPHSTCAPRWEAQSLGSLWPGEQKRKRGHFCKYQLSDTFRACSRTPTSVLIDHLPYRPPVPLSPSLACAQSTLALGWHFYSLTLLSHHFFCPSHTSTSQKQAEGGRCPEDSRATSVIDCHRAPETKQGKPDIRQPQLISLALLLAACEMGMIIRFPS